MSDSLTAKCSTSTSVSGGGFNAEQVNVQWVYGGEAAGNSSTVVRPKPSRKVTTVKKQITSVSPPLMSRRNSPHRSKAAVHKPAAARQSFIFYNASFITANPDSLPPPPPWTSLRSPAGGVRVFFLLFFPGLLLKWSKGWMTFTQEIENALVLEKSYRETN